MSALDVVAARLTDVTGFAPSRPGGGWRCPAHDDRRPSLSVSNGNGRVLLHCQVGCTIEAILGALKLEKADLFDEPGERPERPQVVDRYRYLDEAGELLYEVLRLEGKQFRQRRPDGQGGWIWSLGDTRRVLYRLPGVLAAVADGRSIFVVEGEKDVHALEAAGEVATCNSGGAGKWRVDYADALTGAREVIVVADADEPGRRHARDVALSLQGRVESIHVVEAAAGKDAADHLAAGGSVDEFVVVSDDRHTQERVGAHSLKASRTEPPIVEEPDASGDLFRRWTMPELLDADRSFRWHARGLLVAPTYGFIGGEKKTLKTYVGTMVGIGMATGEPIFGRFQVDDPGAVVNYVGEGGRVPYTRRLERVAAAMGVNPRDMPFHPAFEVAPISSDVFTESLRRDLSDLGPALVMIDPLYAYHGAGTNASNLYEEGALLSRLSGPCMDAGASCMVVSHFNKTGQGRGLDRITQVGGQEWSDTWLLLSHRATPDVANGRFQLLLEVGSRQWGGSTWELDLDVGRFDVDLGEFDGSITWDIRRHAERAPDDEAKVIALVAASPFQLTREELAKGAGGNLQKARALVSTLENRGAIVQKRVTRVRSDGKPNAVWAFGPSEPASDGRVRGSGV